MGEHFELKVGSSTPCIGSICDGLNPTGKCVVLVSDIEKIFAHRGPLFVMITRASTLLSYEEKKELGDDFSINIKIGHPGDFESHHLL